MATNQRKRAESTAVTEQKEVLKSLLDLFLDAHVNENGRDIEDGSPVMSQEHVEEIESFLMQLSTCYQSFGCPTHTIESTMSKVAKGLGVEANFIVFPSHTIFELSTVKTDKGLYRKRSQFFRTSFGYNFYKLQLVDELARRISSYAVDVDTTIAKTTVGADESAVEEVIERARAYSTAMMQQGPPPVLSLPPDRAVDVDVEPTPVFENEYVEHDEGDIEEGRRPPSGTLPRYARASSSTAWASLPTQEKEPAAVATAVPSALPTGFHLLLPSLHRRVEEKRRAKKSQHLQKLGKMILDLALLGPNVYSVEASPQRAKTYKAVFSKLAVEDGIGLIRAITKKKPMYSDLFKSFLLGVASFGCCGMFFGGSWNDMCVALILGIMVARIEAISFYSPSFSRIFEFSATFIASLVIRAINQYWISLCYRAVLMSAIIFTLQGVTITMAFIDLMTRDLITGTTRLFYGMLISALIGFAMDISTSTYASLAGRSYADVFQDSKCDPSRSIDPNWFPLLFVTTTLSFNIILEAHPKQLLQMEIICACCYAVYYYTTAYLSSELPSILAAFTAACLANLYCRFTGQPAVVYVIPAVLLLVPGSVAASSFFDVFTEDNTGGMDLAFSVVTGGMSIAIGLFAASALVPVPDVEEVFNKLNALYPGPKDRSKTHRNSALTI